MAIKQCLACGQSFQQRPQVPLQTYCSAPSCQQHRKGQWRRNKLQTDLDYQENQQRAQQSWIERNEERPETFVKLRAVEYVRMSTEHQQYSTENQSDKIREYAARHDIEIIRTYTDAGKSGMRIDGRVSLQQLLKDVETGFAP